MKWIWIEHDHDHDHDHKLVNLLKIGVIWTSKEEFGLG